MRPERNQRIQAPSGRLGGAGETPTSAPASLVIAPSSSARSAISTVSLQYMRTPVPGRPRPVQLLSAVPYLILGNITFSFMSESTSQALMSFIDAAPLLKKVRVSRFVFPVQKVLFALVNFTFSLVAVALVMLWFRVVPTWHIIWLPVCLFLLVLFCSGIGLIVGSLAVFFRDVVHLWSVILTAWTYLTPIFWVPTQLAANGAPAWVMSIVELNPMYGFVTFMRDIFLWNQNPSMQTLGLCVFWAVIMLGVGILVFRKTQHKFILYI